ncbi:signal recognition particle subunit [Puccinia graminis f. sp. tritici]|uniref:Signal recognition particle subunit n=2 Tax=Puccinia graminis f. sp. tritici TaxID=56615 RepID=E3LB47_PUCGT|nr:uncharacterized protein PGTG_19799 [Puccinia graminis f. sp. tritici CRL 75-36-700-3]EFP93772.1 hypothetical protein PGTG_19799 [Puccinia graminis f. sp. tritici CRL 75-36-700-3]KAA1101709.1 signal recognition particle subunit [Puccinia graminis f. sp. tritici]KAA1136266.1 signal recognition particle subunit [Puccinia graminis f. sp. tritici]
MSRIYELSADDVDDFDFPLEASSSNMPGSSSGPSGSSNMPGMPPNIPGFSNMLAGMMGAGMGPQPPIKKEVDRSRTKNWETIYPRYLDSKAPCKTGGRRVALKYSLRWPLAQLIQHACTQIGLPCQLENDKVHPADWENPGRVKVLIKRNNKPIDPSIPNKYALLCKIGLLLRPLETVRLNLPPPTAKDRNSTPLPNINLRLPYNSPAVSHGFLAMAEAEAQKPTESSGPAIEDAPGSKNKGTKGPADTKKNSKATPKKKKGKK